MLKQVLEKNLSMSEDVVSFCPLELSRAEPSLSATASNLWFKFSTLSDGSIMNHCWCLNFEFLLDKLVNIWLKEEERGFKLQLTPYKLY